MWRRRKAIRHAREQLALLDAQLANLNALIAAQPRLIAEAVDLASRKRRDS